MAKTFDPSGEISIQALGRPFSVGTLYNVFQDKIVEVDGKKPIAHLNISRKENFHSSTPEDILKKIDIDPKAKLGVALGDSKYRGCVSSFLSDVISKDFKPGIGKCCLQQCILSRQHISIPRLMLTLSHDLKKSHNKATHVVKEVSFGCNSIIWIDEEMLDEERKGISTFFFNDMSNYKALFKTHAVRFFFKQKLTSFRCKVYSDVNHSGKKSCNNLLEAFNHFNYVFKYLESHAVPLVVTLHPLAEGRENLNQEICTHIEDIFPLANETFQLLRRLKVIERKSKQLKEDRREIYKLFGAKFTEFHAFVLTSCNAINAQIKSTMHNIKERKMTYSNLQSCTIAGLNCIRWIEDIKQSWEIIKESERLLLDLNPPIHDEVASTVFYVYVLQLPTKSALTVKMRKYLIAQENPTENQPDFSIALKKSLEMFQEIVEIHKGNYQSSFLLKEESKVPHVTGFIRYYRNNELINNNFRLPNKPDCLKVKDVTASSFLLSWMVSDPKPQYYNIMVSNEINDTRIFKSENNYHKIDELDSNTQFRVNVVSFDGPIRSKPSQEIRVTTMRQEVQSNKLKYAEESNLNSQLEKVKLESLSPRSPRRPRVSDYPVFDLERRPLAYDKGAKTEIEMNILPSITSDPCEMSEPFKIKISEDEERKEYIKEQSICTTKGETPQVYLLKMKKIGENENLRKYQFGTQTSNVQEKVIMLLGATGSGKTTLINGIANFFLGIRWDDNFRIKVVSEEEEHIDQTESQTKNITSYTIHGQKRDAMPTSLTLVDTPGFGDTAGLKRDHEIMSQIRELFSSSGTFSLDHIDGIGLVVSSHLARLTVTQKYIFDSILSLFGNDMASNIFPLLTFADNQRPQVLGALEGFKIPHGLHYKFNNSALYADTSENAEFNEMVWEMSEKNYKKFFTGLQTVSPKTLSKTKQVLDERKKLEAQVDSIKHDSVKISEMEREMAAVLSKMQQHQEELVHYENSISYVQRFPVEKNLRLYCSWCKSYCSKSSNLYNQCQWENAIFDHEGYCTKCYNRCPFDNHVYTQSVENKSEVAIRLQELKRKYKNVQAKINQHKEIHKRLSSEINQAKAALEQKKVEIRNRWSHLQQIAFQQSSLPSVEDVEQMIEAERLECETGWNERVHQLEEVKENLHFFHEVTKEVSDFFDT